MREATPGLHHPGALGRPLDDGIVAELIDDLGTDAFEALLRVFEQDLLRRIEQLRLSIAAADGQASRRILHAMAGSSASIGAAALAALCRSAMHATHLTPHLLEQVEDEATAVRAALARCAHAGAGVAR